MKLRQYQEEARINILKLAKNGYKRILNVAPTRSGKSIQEISFLKATSEKGNRALLVVPSRILLSQFCEHLDGFGLEYGVIHASRTANPKALIQISIVHTLTRRIERGDDLGHFDLIIEDEAHHNLSESYKAHREKWPNAFILGFTATPKSGMIETFDVINIVTTPRNLIEQGFLVQPRYFSTPMIPDLSDIKTKDGDYVVAKLEKACNTTILNDSTVEAWIRIMEKTGNPEGLRTIFFGVTCAHSQAVCDRFNSKNIKAEYLDAKTPQATREEILGRFKAGETKVICNCLIIYEGFDCPYADCVIVARPTKSLTLWLQAASRGMTPDQTREKAFSIIIDQGGCFDEHGALEEDRVWSLEKEPEKFKSITKTCKNCYAILPTHVKVCEYCGYVFSNEENEESKRKIEELHLIQLEEIEASKRFSLSILRQVGNIREYKKGWATHVFTKAEKWGSGTSYFKELYEWIESDKSKTIEYWRTLDGEARKRGKTSSYQRINGTPKEVEILG